MYVQSFANKPPAFYGALLAVTLLPLYLGSYWYRPFHSYGGTTSSAAVAPDPIHFVQDWLDVQVVQPFNPCAISAYCNRTDWHPNLVFNLADGARGDIATMRGSMLDFVFYAVEAGASIVLPSFPRENESAVSLLAQHRMSFGVLYDADWFTKAMDQACPQMAIYKPEKEHKMAEALPGMYVPRSRRMDKDQGNAKRAYLEHLDSWLKSKAEFKPDELTLVNIESTQWQVDTRSLPQGFRRDFGQVLRAEASLRRLAALAVQELASRFRTTLDPRVVVPKHGFYGAHLSNKNASPTQPYSNSSAQTEGHLDRAIENNLNIIYVASDDTQLANFQIAAAKHALPLIAASKFDLLTPDDASALTEMTAAQQSMVDFEVLKRCSVFGGSVMSNTSYSIALTRNQLLVDQGKMNDPWFVVHEDVGVVFDDGISRIVGRDGMQEQQIARATWP